MIGLLQKTNDTYSEPDGNILLVLVFAKHKSPQQVKERL